MMCDVDAEAVVAAVDALGAFTTSWKVLHSEGLDAYAVRRLICRSVMWTGRVGMTSWAAHNPRVKSRSAWSASTSICRTRTWSVTEAIRAGSFQNDRKVHLRWVSSDECDAGGAARNLADLDGICVPGFGVRGIEGKLGALTYARENGVPTLGLCLGLQCMVIEFARTVAGLEGANSLEFDESTPHPVVSTMAAQRDVVSGDRDMGGTMRLGLYPAKLLAGSREAAYGQPYVDERHRHRYEVANSTAPPWKKPAWSFGTSPDGRLVEYVELPADTHPSTSAPRPTRSFVLA